MNKTILKLGFWKEFGFKGGSLGKDYLTTPITDDEFFEQTIQYLDNGKFVLSSRHIVRCPYTGDMIDPPTVFTDGKYAWTAPLIYYYKKGQINLDPNFKKHIVENEFKVPPLGSEEIKEINEFIRSV